MNKRIIIQCDFDGTITNKDISFRILEKYATCDWKAELKRYMAGEITVGQFNYNAFISVKEDRETLIKYIREIAETRKGVADFFDFCIQHDFDLKVVSNGLALYINQMLGDIGYGNLPVFAASSEFTEQGMHSVYYDPFGQPTLSEYKESYSRYFKDRADEVVYIGNGSSDFPPASICNYVFSTDVLSRMCAKNGIPHTHFEDFQTVIHGLKQRYLSNG